jgi:hypothetical protein
MLVFVLIVSLATVAFVAWVTLAVGRGRVELRATKALAGVRGAASLWSEPSPPRPESDRQTETFPDADRTGGDDRAVELAVRERLYGQRPSRT